MCNNKGKLTKPSPNDFVEVEIVDGSDSEDEWFNTYAYPGTGTGPGTNYPPLKLRRNPKDGRDVRPIERQVQFSKDLERKIGIFDN